MLRTLPIIALSAALVTAGCGDAGPGGEIPGGETVEVELPPFDAPLTDEELLIRVLDAEGRPAVGAEVRFLDTLTVDPVRIKRSTLGMPDAELMLDRLASVAILDETALVRFPWSGGPTIVDAALGETYCMSAFREQSSGRLTLSLERQPGLRVRVQAPDGSPLDTVPVELCVRTEGGPQVPLAMRWPRDGDGLARFRDPRGGVRPGGDDVRHYTVGCAVVGAARVGMPFDPAAPPAAVIELRAPETCSVEVECVDERGRLLPLDGLATLEGASEPGCRVTMPLVRGRCRFEAVAPGTLVRVVIEPGPGRAPASTIEPSALEAGGEVILRVEVGAPPVPTKSSAERMR